MRSSMMPSRLSKFLVGEGSLAAPSTFDKPDPIEATHGPIELARTRRFGDLLRRQQSLADAANGACTATGLLHSFNLADLRGLSH